MSQAAQQLFTPEEYLARERVAETKSEYHDGAVFAMAGGTAPHAELAATFIRELGARGKGGPCRIYSSDMRVLSGERNFVYPDVSGLCTEPRFRDDARDVLRNPSFVVEVLSPSTEAYDRGRKLAIHMAVPSITEIVLVCQDQVRVDKYTRLPDGVWRFDTIEGRDSHVRFESLGCEIVLADFFDGVELAPLPPPPERS
ncbi:MAG: Uma2 family endonuclease [Chthoniobacteraceae bacterium]